MRPPLFLKPAAVVLAGLWLLYSGGYVLLRLNHQMVHQSMNDGAHWTRHTVGGGDAPLTGAWINSGLADVYAPFCALELRFWKIRQPLRGPVPPEVRNRNGPRGSPP